VLRAAADRLYRSPHVPSRRQQIPSTGHERLGFDTSAVITFPRRTSDAIAEHLRPHALAVTGDHSVRAAECAGLVRIQGCVNAAVDDVCARRARGCADRVAVERIAGVDADTHDVARLDRACVERFERLVNERRLTVGERRRRGEYVQPSRRDHANAERDVARVDEIHLHRTLRLRARPRWISGMLTRCLDLHTALMS
jgi:hypothetical protein